MLEQQLVEVTATTDIQKEWNKRVNRIGLAMVFSALIPILLMIVICLTMADVFYAQKYILNILCSVVSVVPFIVLAKSNNLKYKEKDLQIKDKIIYVFCGFCVLILLQLLCGLAIRFLDEYLFNGIISATMPNLLPTELTRVNLIIYYLYVCFIGPLAEEYIFRGVIFKSLEQYGLWFAVIISAVLFGFMHMNLNQMLSAMVIGLVFGFIRAKSGSILLTVILHIVNNVIAVVITQEFFLNALKQNVVLVIGYLFICFIGLLTLIIGFISSKRVFCLNGENIVELPNKFLDFFASPTIIIYILIVIKIIALNVKIIK